MVGQDVLSIFRGPPHPTVSVSPGRWPRTRSGKRNHRGQRTKFHASWSGARDHAHRMETPGASGSVPRHNPGRRGESERLVLLASEEDRVRTSRSNSRRSRKSLREGASDTLALEEAAWRATADGGPLPNAPRVPRSHNSGRPVRTAVMIVRKGVRANLDPPRRTA